jgi:hypothetical protein
MIYKILVMTHMFSGLYMAFTWWWLAEAETCSEKTCVIHTREKLVANEALVFYCVLFVRKVYVHQLAKQIIDTKAHRWTYSEFNPANIFTSHFS